MPARRVSIDRSPRPPRARRGFAYLMVLSLMSVAMALSYAMVRSQTTATLIQQNQSREAEAVQAASAAMSIALRTMSTSSWTGVGTTLNGTLGNNQSYVISWQAGDASLQPTDPLYLLRVTVDVVGRATDDATASSSSRTYRIRSVVQLTPRSLSPGPTGWAAAAPYTVYQFQPPAADDFFDVDFPFQIAGRARIKKNASLLPTYPNNKPHRLRYAADLGPGFNASVGHDCRPFTDMVDLQFDTVNQEFRDLLEATGVTSQDVASSDVGAWNYPGNVTTYRVYPGGPVYTANSLPRGTLSGTAGVVTLGPTATNPLGVYCGSGETTLGANVVVHGSLMVANRGTLLGLLTGPDAGSVVLNGTGIRVKPVSLPPLDGASGAVQIPALQLAGGCFVSAGASAEVLGLVNVQDRLEVLSDNRSNVNFVLSGKLIARNVRIGPRTDWNVGGSWWSDTYNEFKKSGYAYFPSFVYVQGQAEGRELWPDPWAGGVPGQIRISPPDTAVNYVWKDANNTIYAADPADGGLRWDVVDWKSGL